jgi:hypothetical protein
MLNEEEKRVLERIVTENPERGKLQQELQRLVEQILDDIIDREGS